jgi:hypothetical protein
MNTAMDVQVPEWAFVNIKPYLHCPAFREVKSFVMKCA